MKTITSFAAAALSLTLFQACKSNKTSSTKDSTVVTTTKVSTDSIKRDTAAIAAKADTAFANKAAIGGMAEVALGKLAAGTSKNPQIKDFGKMMVTGHTRADSELMAIAKTKA